MITTPLPAVVLLDVDGVINVERPGWPGPHKRATVKSDGVSYPFRWSPDLIASLHDMFLLDLIEIRWCSTWAHEATKLNILFDLPRLPGCWDYASIPGHPTRKLKLAAAHEVIDSGRRLIWCDDDAIPGSKHRRQLGLPPCSTDGSGTALYIQPNGITGMTQAHIWQIQKFATWPYTEDPQ
jgi:hypothetical protein